MFHVLFNRRYSLLYLDAVFAMDLRVDIRIVFFFSFLSNLISLSIALEVLSSLWSMEKLKSPAKIILPCLNSIRSFIISRKYFLGSVLGQYTLASVYFIPCMEPIRKRKRPSGSSFLSFLSFLSYW